MADGTEEELARADALGRKLGVGCFSIFTGFFSGGMITVLLGMFVAFLSRQPKCEGVPLCDWYVWFFTGGALGALSLPIFVVPRLGRPKAPPENTDRG